MAASLATGAASAGVESEAAASAEGALLEGGMLDAAATALDPREGVRRSRSGEHPMIPKAEAIAKVRNEKRIGRRNV